MNTKNLCLIASVSRSGYYKWSKSSDKPEKDHKDYVLVRDLFMAGKQKYGFRTIQMKLSEKGITMNHKKIQRIMKKYNLVTKIRRKNPYKNIMKESLQDRTFENKLNREFKQKIPFKVFCTDITYLPLNHSFVYLSVIKDISSGEIVSWDLSKQIEMSLVTNTMKNLEKNKNIKELSNIMIHSDQGFHYKNPSYINTVKRLGMIQSMSRKGNCIDNAPIESFFGHLKDDVDYDQCKTFNQVYSLINKYMRYYNHKRPQWNLKKMTPVKYRNHLLESVT